MSGITPSAQGDKPAETAPEIPLDEAHATRSLRNGLISLAILVALAVGLLLAVPGLHNVGREVADMPVGLVLAAIGCEILSCVGYVIAFLQVFDRAPIRFGARVALSELAFGAAVSLGGAGSVAVGAWLLVERGAPPTRAAERSAVLFLFTSAINVIVLAVTGLALWVHILPGDHDPLLSLVPGAVGTVTFFAFLALPWITDRVIGDGPHGRVATVAHATAGVVRSTEHILFSSDWRTIGAFAFLLLDIAVLGICFAAVGPAPPVSTLILAYQIGYLSNLIPVPGGIGILDGSFVGMFVLYGLNATRATAATVVYHTISLWVPAMWGTVAYLLLRRSRHQPLVLRPGRDERRAARR